MNPYEGTPTGDFVAIILEGDERADEAMYYLLHQRLHLQLEKQFEFFRARLLDGLDDVVDDFFLYLRNGKDHNAPLYLSVRRIRNHDTFGRWLVNTFRNYLSARAAKDGPLAAQLDTDNVTGGDTPHSILTDERKLAIASHLIAYTHQEMAPREGFIFLRILLTMLNRQKALPNESVAHALGMTDIAYRVTVHRIKESLIRYRTSLLQCKTLSLDDMHRQMASRINDDFNHLYPTLFQYYIESIGSLDNAASVRRLREEYLTSTGGEVHEPVIPYTASLSIHALWNMLTGFLEE